MNLLNSFLANLMIMNIKLHNIHWNVIGMNFMQVHNFTEALYDEFFTRFDDVAELIKMRGETPLGSLAEYLEEGTIKESNLTTWIDRFVVHALIEDFEILLEQANDIRESEEDDFVVAAAFDDIIGWLTKNLWFLNSMRKGLPVNDTK